VLGILKKLQDMAFSTSGVENPYWALQAVLKRMTAINQGPTETVSNYYSRFLATIDVTEALWGKCIPTKFVANSNLSTMHGQG
jgi:hypothetical protein